MAVLAKHTKLVNDAIESMGVDPKICVDENTPNVWKLHRGEAQVIMVLQDSTIYPEAVVPTLSIMSPVAQATQEPNERLKLYQHLLEVNHKLATETFSVSNDWVILSATCYMEDATQFAIRQLLDSLSYHAQQFFRQHESLAKVPLF